MDKDSTGKGAPESTDGVGSGAPATPGASGKALGGGTRSGVSHTDTAAGQGGGQMTEDAAERAKPTDGDA